MTGNGEFRRSRERRLCHWFYLACGGKGSPPAPGGRPHPAAPTKCMAVPGGVLPYAAANGSPIGVGDDGCVVGGEGEFWRVEATPVVFRGCFG